jgi:hypothetical protein
MNHIVLLGDSVFDNRAYVGRGERDVIFHLRDMIPSDWQATLAAVDGSVVENVGGQLARIPAEAGATHLFVSVGGNDALMNSDLLQMRASSSAEVFDALASRAGDFESRYKTMLETILRLNLPTAVCTIYFPNFPDAFLQKIATAALSVFNDAIIRQAFAAGVPLLDLRFICSEKTDYANEIEPSDQGGRKIAAKIFEIVRAHDFSRRQTSVYF